MFNQLITLLMLMQQMPAPGTSGALMVTYQRQTYHQEFGMADDESQTPITSATRFVIGSTSKQYTTTAIYKLEEKGLLKTTDSITNVLKELPFITVTIDQLMNHTSGIPDAYDQPLLQKKLYQKPITLADFFKALKGKKLTAKPGATFAYTNTNYVLLGEIIRRLSGKPFDQFMRDEFFEPLGLEKTTAGFSLSQKWRPTTREDLKYQQIALCYYPHEGQRYDYITLNEIGELHLQGFFADGNIITTSEEMHQWVRLLMTGEILSEKSFKKMMTPSKISSYGAAWFILEDENGRPYYEHGGEWLGYQSHIRHYPNEDLTITWISNQYEDATGIPVFVDQIAEALLIK